jgi:hypothetical protein
LRSISIQFWKTSAYCQAGACVFLDKWQIFLYVKIFHLFCTNEHLSICNFGHFCSLLYSMR